MPLRSWTTRRARLGLAAASLLFSILLSRPFPRSAISSGGASGIPDPGPTLDPALDPAAANAAPASITSPSGRSWRFGETDELGYVMPLDVRRPRPDRLRGMAPARDETLARRAAAGAVFADDAVFEEHRVSPDDGHTQNETAIDAVLDTVVSVFHTYTDTSLLLGVARSLDGGHTWQESSVSGSHSNLTDPCIKAAGGGRWHLSYLAAGGIGGQDFDVFVRTSTDAGASFGLPTAVTSDSNFDDKPYMAARGDDVLIGYADFGFSPAKLRAARSTNGGTSFDHDTILANNSIGGNGACPVIDASGVYYVFWRDSFQDSLWVSSSTDRGESWSADRGIAGMFPLPSQLPGGFRIVNIPSAAADPLTGCVVVVWNDQRFGNPDIVSTRSTDGGISWSAPVRVNDDAGNSAQFFPWIAFDPQGIAHVCWYDRREDGFKIDVYYARSTDDGASFDANTRVTAQAFTPVLPWDTTVAFIGDYNAIAASTTTIYPCYQDAREGNQDVYVALIPGEPAGLAGEAPAALPVAMLTAAPSPFAGRVVLRDASHPGGVVEITTPLGRRVCELWLGPDGVAAWDGRDAQGAELARGVYFARVRGAGTTTRLVKLR